MDKRKIWIRADGNGQIGLGHLVRCIALGQMLQDHFLVTFVCTDIPELLKTEIIGKGFALNIVDREEAFLLRLSSGHIVVLDGYHFDTVYQLKIKQAGAKLVCIDDLHNQEFFADLIINHAPGINTGHYRAQHYTSFALGVDYALLRPSFLNSGKTGTEASKKNIVFICFGGADSKNLTKRVLRFVMEEVNTQEIIVVTGSSYQYTAQLEVLIKNDERVSHFHGVGEEDMAQIMQQSRIAVVPSSGILFEVLAMSNIAISGYYVDNQKDIYEGFKSEGLVIGGGDFSDTYFRDHKVFDQAISRTVLPTRNVIDGRSGSRILEKFKGL